MRSRKDSHHRSCWGKTDSRPVTTFFVSNLPRGVTDTMLWMAFQPHGIVKDAYVARKTDSRGNWFGFVRYVGVSNLNEVLKNMNTVKIMEAKVGVSVAKYDKNNRRVTQPVTDERMDKQGEGGETHNHMKYVPVNKFNGVSYRNVVTGGKVTPSVASKVLVVEERAALYPSHCIMRTVIGEAKDVDALRKVRSMMKTGGYDESPTSLIGGMKVMMVFRDKRTALEFISKKDTLWGEVFISTVLWGG